MLYIFLPWKWYGTSATYIQIKYKILNVCVFEYKKQLLNRPGYLAMSFYLQPDVELSF